MNKYLVSLCLGFLILTGCNRLDFAFHWADTYIASKVDDYFDISSKQSRELKKGIQKDLQALRSEVIPQWVDRLNSIKKEMSEGSVNEARVGFYFALFIKDIEQINSHFSETAVDFISSTNPQQIEYFTKSFHKKNAEDLEKARDLAKLQKEYRDKYTEWFEMFLGSLTSEQKKMIEENLANSPFPLELKIKNKEYLLQKFLEHKNSSEQMKAFVRDYYTHPESQDLPEYREAFEKYQQNLQKLVAQVLTSVTSKQKEALKESLSEKTAQLQLIAARG